jgi:hypothetical protein
MQCMSVNADISQKSKFMIDKSGIIGYSVRAPIPRSSL